MSVRILFLGPLADLAGQSEMTLEAPLGWTQLMAQVPAAVAERMTEERVNVACGGMVLGDKTSLRAQDGDEVALLPPVSGG